MRMASGRKGGAHRRWVGLAAGILLSAGAGAHARDAGAQAEEPVDGAATAVAATAPVCLFPAEREGWQVRVLQTQLMVAALSCRGGRAARHVEFYNALVMARRAELRRAAAGFRRAVARTAGSRAVDGAVTAIANEITRAALDRPDFCEQAAHLARAIAETPDAPLVAFTRLMPVQLPPPAPSCAGGDGLVAAND